MINIFGKKWSDYCKIFGTDTLYLSNLGCNTLVAVSASSKPFRDDKHSEGSYYSVNLYSNNDTIGEGDRLVYTEGYMPDSNPSLLDLTDFAKDKIDSDLVQESFENLRILTDVDMAKALEKELETKLLERFESLALETNLSERFDSLAERE